jgi:hypothetical protein
MPCTECLTVSGIFVIPLLPEEGVRALWKPLQRTIWPSQKVRKSIISVRLGKRSTRMKLAARAGLLETYESLQLSYIHCEHVHVLRDDFRSSQIQGRDHLGTSQNPWPWAWWLAHTANGKRTSTSTSTKPLLSVDWNSLGKQFVLLLSLITWFSANNSEVFCYKNTACPLIDRALWAFAGLSSKSYSRRLQPVMLNA